MNTGEGTPQTHVLCLCSFVDEREHGRVPLDWVHDKKASGTSQGTTPHSIQKGGNPFD